MGTRATGISLGTLCRIARGRRARWVAAGLAATVLGTAAAAYATRAEPAASAAPATSPVDRGTVTLEIAATGSAVPAQTRGLGFAVSGTVAAVRVQPGDTVSAGQQLATIDDESVREKVAQANADLADAQTALADVTEAAAEAAEEQADCSTATAAGAAAAAGAAGTGDSGTVLLASAASGTAPTPTPRTTTTPTASPSTATSPTAAPPSTAPPTAAPKPTASRRPSGTPSGTTGTARPDGDTGTAPSGQPDGACTDHGGSAGAGGSSSGSGSGGGSGDQILSAEQRVNGARQQLAVAEEQLAGTVIAAPFDGKVLSVAGTVGSAVGSGGTFIELADVNDMQVSAEFPEADAGLLAAGQKAVVTLPARPDDEFAATVIQVDPVGTSSGSMVTYGTLLAFTESPGDMLVGQSASVRITTAEVTDAVRVPATAVRGTGEGMGEVRVVAGAGTELRPVRVGLRGDRYTEIASGLTVGELVLTSG